ncbi:MAG TPA: hypothetical protein HA346_05590 [Thermoplasmata archaeon]|nr:hypothetical protein [Thermoplasmata archaeon]
MKEKSEQAKLSYKLSRIMQFCLILLAIYSFYKGEFVEGASCLFGFFLTLLPMLLTRELKIVLPWELIFLIVLTLLLHLMGFVLNFYRLPGWDVITHFTSSILIALLSFTIVMILDRYVASIKLNRLSIAFLTVFFTLACGVFWELGEFAHDFLTKGTQQVGYLDTISDLIVDLIGGAFIAIVGTAYIGFPIEKTRELIEKLNVGHLLQKEGSEGGKTKKTDWQSLFSRLVPAFILIAGVYFFIKRDYVWGSLALASVLFSFSPMVIKKHFIFLPGELSLMFFLFLGLHLSAGIITSALQLESITRFVSSGMVATFGLIGVVVLDRYSSSIKINPDVIPFFIIMFVLAAGAALKIGEFVYLNYFGFTNPTNHDLMIDFLYDFVAGMIIAIPGTLYLKYMPDKKFVK